MSLLSIPDIWEGGDRKFIKNPFEALCVLAANERWCWKMYCGTCGHMIFRYGLWEIARGKHPNKSDWLVSKNRNDLGRGRPVKEIGPIPPFAPWPMDIQTALSDILSDADLKNIRYSCSFRFPDWLGYLGLGLHYSEDVEKIRRVISQSWIPQLIRFLPPDSLASNVLGNIVTSGDEVLTWPLLDLIEHAM